MKRLFIFSDGTWATPESEIRTNVYNIATGILHSHKGVQQLVYYDPGVGSEGSWASRIMGGAFGDGIDLNIQQLYTFLAMNYEDGDEIYLFGYSRGAYSVRSLAGMLHEAGLVTRAKLHYVKEAYDLYRTNKDPESDTAKQFREEHSRRVKITLLACFDTVGSLGLPDGIASRAEQRKYEFHDTTLSSDVEHGIHLVSIDEDRKSFQPTLMKGKEGQVTQLYLPGGHGGVGGGNKDEVDLSRNSLLVMLEECGKRCDFGVDMTEMPKEMARSVPFVGVSDALHRLLRLFTGAHYREIASVEALHESVFERYQSVKEWRPPALERFRQALMQASGGRR